MISFHNLTYPQLELLDLPHVDLLHLLDRLPQRGELPAGRARLGLRRRTLVEVAVRGPGDQMKVLEVTLGKNQVRLVIFHLAHKLK